jgi:hypothetical protein
MKKDDGKLMSEYVIVLENNLKEAHETTRKNLNAAAKRQKMTYDVIVRPVTYEVGDLVINYIRNTISWSWNKY